MKYFKLLFVIVLSLLVVTTAFGQGQVKFGLKGGLNLANATGDDADLAMMEEGLDKSMRMGLAIGAFMVYDLSDVFVLQPEVYYSMQGANYEKGGQEANFKIDYIQIPVLIKYMFPENSVQPFLFAGPALGINMSAKIKSPDGEEDIKDDVKGTDFGLAIGGGLNFGQISIDARYVFGLSTIIDIEGADVDVDVKNSVITFMLGYTFP